MILRNMDNHIALITSGAIVTESGVVMIKQLKSIYVIWTTTSPIYHVIFRYRITCYSIPLWFTMTRVCQLLGEKLILTRLNPCSPLYPAKLLLMFNTCHWTRFSLYCYQLLILTPVICYSHYLGPPPLLDRHCNDEVTSFLVIFSII